MLLPVRLLGVQLPWSLLGTTSLDAWLATLPWGQGGGVLGVRVAGAHSAQLLLSELRTAVRTLDDGATAVETEHCILGEDDERSPLTMVCDSLGVDEGPDAGRKTRLAQTLDFSPRVLVIDATACQDQRLRSLGVDLEELKNELAKRNPRARLVVILLHQGAMSSDWIEMDVGGPIAPLLEDAPDKPHRNWAIYLHTRLAWESAGNLDRAMRWEQEIGSRVGFGQDAQLETFLNKLAIQEWGRVSPALANEVRDRLRRVALRKAPTDESLMRQRLFWKPHGSTVSRPAPWVARALLLEGKSGEAYELLRVSLVCGPLLRAAVGRCLDLEAHARTRFREFLRDPQQLEPEASSRFAAFRAGRGPDVHLYPKGCPAQPTNGWAFTEFGPFIGALQSLPQTHREALNDLRTLRNALAHGHFVPWIVFEKLREVESIIRS